MTGTFKILMTPPLDSVLSAGYRSLDRFVVANTAKTCGVVACPITSDFPKDGFVFANRDVLGDLNLQKAYFSWIGLADVPGLNLEGLDVKLGELSGMGIKYESTLALYMLKTLQAEYDANANGTVDESELMVYTKDNANEGAKETQIEKAFKTNTILLKSYAGEEGVLAVYESVIVPAYSPKPASVPASCPASTSAPASGPASQVASTQPSQVPVSQGSDLYFYTTLALGAVLVGLAVTRFWPSLETTFDRNVK